MSDEGLAYGRRSTDVLDLEIKHLRGEIVDMRRDIRQLNQALIGDAERAGWISKVAACSETVETHKRNFRVLAIAFITQTGALIVWGAQRAWELISQQ